MADGLDGMASQREEGYGTISAATLNGQGIPRRAQGQNFPSVVPVHTLRNYWPRIFTFHYENPGSKFPDSLDASTTESRYGSVAGG